MKISREQLKNLFFTKKRISQSSLYHFVDSVPNYVDDGYVTGFAFRGAWSVSEDYIVNDTVTYNGETYACILSSTGDTPTDTVHWTKLVEKGESMTIDIGTVESGETASITDVGTPSAAVLNFVLPKGDKGDDGDDGNGIVSITLKSTVGKVKTYTILFTDATTVDFDVTDGADGVGSGDVIGPASAVDSNFAAFDAITGKLIKDSGKKTADFAAALGADDNYVTDTEKTAIGTIGDKAPTANPTFTGLVTTPAIKITTGASLGKVLTSDADGDATWETPAAGGASLWTAPTGATRVSNTTFTVTGDQTAIFKKGMIIKWAESSTVRCAMVSIPSTVSTDTTVTIIGDTMASIDSGSLKYCLIGAEGFIKEFAVAGTIGAIASDVSRAYYATEPMRVLGADLSVGTAGTTNNTTVDLNKAGTTMFTTKPTLATTVSSSPTPFTADTTSALALGDKVTMDIDAIQTTAAIDLYVQLYLFPTRYLTLN